VAYLSHLRYGDILALQGPPLLGAVFVLREPTAERCVALVLLALANVLLVSHIFVFNDSAGVDSDLKDANKRAGAFATKGLSRRGIGRLWLILLAASLGLFAFLGPRTLLLALTIVLLSSLYSSPRTSGKSFPILGSILHLVGGMLHLLLGVSLFGPIDGAAIAVALLCGLAFTAGHLTQEVRDFEGDRANGIRTNAVVFGQRRTFIAGLAVFTATYAQLCFLAAGGVFPRWLGILGGLFAAHLYWSLKALQEGLSFASVRRLQARYRAIFAVIGVAILSALLLSGARLEPGRAPQSRVERRGAPSPMSSTNRRMLEFSPGGGSLPPLQPLCQKPCEPSSCFDRPAPSSV
jgi:4-hydroxybenzoate polyprenyltransferase